ncbi:MAG: hypothetical protein P4L27_04430 [Ignavibacteriaceae bacterium]|jgi:hypothetical protein|nr:hypothetical protein [Ignavibacteriaceae bacterium]
MKGKIFSKVKETASSITEKISDIKEDLWGEEQKLIIQEFKDSSSAKIKDTLEKIGNSSDLFVRAGYELNDVSINLGIPPDITTSYHFLKDIPEEEQNKLLEETKESKLIHLIIQCLLKASNYFDKIKVGNYKMSSVSISLGLTPGINIHFSK